MNHLPILTNHPAPALPVADEPDEAETTKKLENPVTFQCAYCGVETPSFAELISHFHLHFPRVLCDESGTAAQE